MSDDTIPMFWPEVGPRPHPYAAVFRMLVGEERESLAANVADKGLQERVKIYEEKILDGRNRYLVLVDEGVFDPEIETWRDRPELFEEFAGTREQALDYVWSLNAERRHDTPSQRAIAAERYANLRKITQAEAAAKFGVSERQVNSAAKVLEQAEPEVVQAVEEGRLPLYLAEQVADLAENDQREVAELPKREASAAAKEKVANKTPAQRVADKYISGDGEPTREQKAAHRMMLPQGRRYISFLHHVIEAARWSESVSSEWLRDLALEYRLISDFEGGEKVANGGFIYPADVVQHVQDVGGIMPGLDEIGRKLIKAGLVHNEYLLKLNRSLTNPSAGSKSRLLKFPIEFIERDDQLGTPSQLRLRHPALADLPFVKEVEQQTGIPVIWEPLDKFGRDFGATAQWWHAVDLAEDDGFEELIATRHLTTDDAIGRGAEHGLTYGRLSPANARKLLAVIGAAEPADRSAELLRTDGISIGDKGSVSIHPSAERDWGTAAWIAVHGLEDGWFRIKGGFPKLTPEGAKRREAPAPIDPAAAYRAALEAGTEHHGKHTIKTIEPILRSSIPAGKTRQQVADDTGSKIGSILGWSGKLELTGKGEGRSAPRPRAEASE
jgi:hypothetical protein